MAFGYNRTVCIGAVKVVCSIVSTISGTTGPILIGSFVSMHWVKVMRLWYLCDSWLRSGWSTEEWTCDHYNTNNTRSIIELNCAQIKAE